MSFLFGFPIDLKALFQTTKLTSCWVNQPPAFAGVFLLEENLRSVCWVCCSDFGVIDAHHPPSPSRLILSLWRWEPIGGFLDECLTSFGDSMFAPALPVLSGEGQPWVVCICGFERRQDEAFPSLRKDGLVRWFLHFVNERSVFYISAFDDSDSLNISVFWPALKD